MPGQPSGGGYIPSEMNAEILGHAQQSLDKVIEEKVPKEIITNSIAIQGNPAEGITNYAEEHDMNAIIIGTHGYTGWRHLLIGSVTEKVVRSAPCPVITIPADKE